MSGKFEFAYSLSNPGEVPAIEMLPVATSQTLKAGDPVAVSGGQVVIGGNGFGRMLGVMAQDATSLSANTLVAVQVDQPGFVWRATATADASGHIMDARTYDLDSSQHVNISDTTGGCFEIVKVGSSNTQVYVVATAHELA